MSTYEDYCLHVIRKLENVNWLCHYIHLWQYQVQICHMSCDQKFWSEANTLTVAFQRPCPKLVAILK